MNVEEMIVQFFTGKETGEFDEALLCDVVRVMADRSDITDYEYNKAMIKIMTCFITDFIKSDAVEDHYDVQDFMEWINGYLTVTKKIG